MFVASVPPTDEPGTASSMDSRWPAEPTVARGEVAIYVARGSVEVDVDGTVTTLGEGEAVRFDGSLPHRLRRAGGTSTRALIVVS